MLDWMDDDDKQMHLDDMQDRVNKQFFIDRTGRIYKYNGNMMKDVVSIHYEIAYKLFPNMDNPDDYLMKLGWVMVGSSVHSSPITHKKVSQSQLDTLFDLNQLKFSFHSQYEYAMCIQPLYPTNIVKR